MAGTGWPGRDLRDDPGFWRAVVQGAAALVCVVDREGRVVVLNRALERSTGWTEAEVLGRRFVDVLVAPEDVAGAEEHLAEAFATGSARPQEGDWLDRDGARRRVAMENSVLRDDAGAPYAFVSVGVDVTERRLAEAALRDRADSDVLTGLRNRGAFFAELQRALVSDGDGDARAVGLLFCDLDGFKRANDTHGHVVGDTLLVEVAARLRAAVGDGAVVARLGGDEFVVLVPGADDGALEALAGVVEAEIRRPFTLADGVVQLGVSVGTAIGRPGSAVADELVATADRRMYVAKSTRSAAVRARPRD